MLISFTVDNWMSFRHPVTFSMVASKERQHGERLTKLGKFQTRIVPIAVLFGGNASGKTNLFRALSFARNLVVKGTQPDGLIPVETFRLDASSAAQATHFSFELLIDEVIYDFAFGVDQHRIIEESLTLITSTSEKTLYQRQDGHMVFDAALANEPFLQFAFQGTRDNQLFLTNSVSQKVEHFKPVYSWFKDTLELLAPDSRFEPFARYLDTDQPLYAAMNKVLAQLDTGIEQLADENIALATIALSESLKTRLHEEVKTGMPVQIRAAGDERFVIERQGSELVAKKLVSVHVNSDGTKVRFDTTQESDGAQRVIDLLPAMLTLLAADAHKVYVIDEFDRSLHTLLCRRLLQIYLDTCGAATRKQLLLTAHDALLLDQKVLRRDEIWVVERDETGVSNALSLSEYRGVRYDKDIRKSYLQGLLGGVPRLELDSASLFADMQQATNTRTQKRLVH